VDTQKLQEKVEGMLEGENKRRKVAIQWLGNIESILCDVAPKLWGKNTDTFGIHCAKWVSKISNGKTTLTPIYLRYGYSDSGNFFEGNESVKCSFRMRDDDQGPAMDGKSIENLHGKDFWWAIRTIMEWIPIVLTEIDEKNDSRQKLVDTMKI
jgi:hypothetical protein